MPVHPKVVRNSSKNAQTRRNNESVPTIMTKKNDGEGNVHVNSKRPAEGQLADVPNSKRSVLGNLTNAVGVMNEIANVRVKKTITVPEKRRPVVGTELILRPRDVPEIKKIEEVVAAVLPPKKATREQQQVADVPAPSVVQAAPVPEKRRSLRVREQRDKKTVVQDETPETDYESAKESLDDSSDDDVSMTEVTASRKRHVSLPSVPEGVLDFDRETALDPFSVPVYAQDIFLYFKERESKFAVDKYMGRQREVTKNVRAVLVDWMAEVQESFELNHETLYLGVKLVDMYLARRHVDKNRLQLVGSTALLIAAKFDERLPPIVDDFLYICDDAYDRPQLLNMEMDILHAIDFDLGAPLSYSYLRRFARCSKQSMEMLTLGRYILELSLLEYEMVDLSESLVAAAALSLALQMKQREAWSATLEHYSTYKLSELQDVILRLNCLVVNARTRNLNTIPTKYSHKVFFEVANVPPLKLAFA